MPALSRVLYVDDEPSICRVFTRLFETEPHVQVTTRSSAGQAVHLLGAQKFDVVVCDLRMSGMNGIELLSFAKNVQPGARRILVSGIIDLEALINAVNRAGIDNVMLKPWDNQELVDAVLGACARAAAQGEQERQINALRGRLENMADAGQVREQQLEARTAEFLDGLLHCLETREPGARARGRRLSTHARRLGKELGLRGQALCDVEHGALLAEIGRLTLPDALLRKAGLDHAGYCELMRHPMSGYRLLEQMPFLERARIVVLQHHERYDGSGYPSGLCGEQISLGARIYAVVALADEIGDVDAAALEIHRRAGTWLDPIVAAAWQRIDWSELPGAVESAAA